MGTSSIPYDEKTRQLLQTFGFDEVEFESLRQRLRDGLATDASNRIDGRIDPPAAEDIDTLPPLGSAQREALSERGAAAIADGKVGVVVLTGGMATRFGGVVKGAVEVIGHHTFLDLKLHDVARCAERLGARVPVFLMTSFATHDDVVRLASRETSAATPIECFPQFISLRLTPDGELFRTNEGALSPYAPGHGDLPFALRASGVLSRFRAAGGEILFMSNVDNLTATLDPAIIGAHLAAGVPMTVEVADKVSGDKGGAPARVDGRVEIVESFRFPARFDQDRIPVFNTNTMLFDAAALDRDFELSWFEVEKRVDARSAIQFERLVGQLSAFVPMRCLRVERKGDDARFQPIKAPEDLTRLAPTIEAVLAARGSL